MDFLVADGIYVLESYAIGALVLRVGVHCLFGSSSISTAYPSAWKRASAMRTDCLPVSDRRKAGWQHPLTASMISLKTIKFFRSWKTASNFSISWCALLSAITISSTHCAHWLALKTGPRYSKGIHEKLEETDRERLIACLNPPYANVFLAKLNVSNSIDCWSGIRRHWYPREQSRLQSIFFLPFVVLLPVMFRPDDYKWCIRLLRPIFFVGQPIVLVSHWISVVQILDMPISWKVGLW